MNKNFVLAVDLGGTNMRMAAVATDGTRFPADDDNRKSDLKIPTPKESGPAGLLEAFEHLANKCRTFLPEGSQVVGVAAGVPANVGPDGILKNLPNLRSLEGMDLKSDLAAKFGVPATIENDATAAAIGENWLGASKDVGDSIMITLGTGVGGGIIINNEPIRGIDGTAGKLGHMCVEPDGHPCKCGSNGCIEQYASATAIKRMAEENGLGSIDSFEVYKAAQSGDKSAQAVFKKMGRLLGIHLGSLANALNPEMIVIGGGAAAAWDAFIGHVTTELKYRAFNEPADRIQIVRGQLGDNAGILGAAKSAFTQLRS
jgi:glucokinase